MVSIVPLQRRTEASAAARSIFSLEERSAGGGMDLSGTQGELAIPMHANAVSPYGGGAAVSAPAAAGHVLQLHHHEHGHGGSNNGLSPSPVAEETEGGSAAKKRGGGGAPAVALAAPAPAVRYRECLKNHAAAIGGSATDGCGEFMPSGEDGSLEALKCSACGCHRNFHRKELDGDAADADADDVMYASSAAGHRATHRLLAPAMPYRGSSAGAGGLLVSTAAGDPYAAYAAAARALPPPPPPGHGHPHHHGHHQYVMPLSMVHNSESDEMDGGGGGGGGGSSSAARKRFRTKFSPEQKARMLEFAERVGWRLQKLDEGMVDGFCQEIGVKRRVLKVWMHNNKHSLATTRRIDMEHSPAAAAGMPSRPAEAAPQMPLQMVPPGVMPAPPQAAGPSCHRGGGPGSPPQPGLKLE
ncbi:unnamed protein product [Urochloa decumbens]|uniref:ZF-HD dimerization-type domain-containing protein n=1 Tax=Urochloa decumbens TaxID=240449 RepID=A0ABC9AN40_9POAL